ncbi:MAG TPA: M20/M25/M40 family metallo-hydrolase [Thermoanaerobaculia bacterium]
MKRALVLALLTLTALPIVPPLRAEEPVDLTMMTRIRDEGLHHSQVMETLYNLTDVIGPRLTGSPQAKRANEWTRDQFTSWGLANAHLEGYPFGRGWSFSSCQVHLTSPHPAVLLGYPKAWTPGTQGVVHGQVMKVKIESEKDLDQYRGKVAGKILLIADVRDPNRPSFPEPPERYTKDDLVKLAEYEIREERDFRPRALERVKLRQAVNKFLETEKVLATLELSPRANGIVTVSSGGSRKPGESTGTTALVLAAESYNEILRLLDHDQPVELDVDVAARFYDDDPQAYDTIAEIPGTDKKDEIVMAGAHLDSWHSGTGATDNAAGSAVVMEAARILKALGVKPRRTIRFALWTGEEQGLLGSHAYVQRHFGGHPVNDDPAQKDTPEEYRELRWPLQLKPEHARLSAYFNLDNGSGKVRGIYAQENTATAPIFAAWLAPFADLGADTVTLRNTGSTDHVELDQVGLPGFQFIQDGLDYFTHTHHTNIDTYEHLEAKDMMQASVLMAAFLYDAAMRPEPLPRKPLPQEPPKKKSTGERKETAP